MPWGSNHADSRKKNSLWYYDRPNLFDRTIQLITGILKFTQSDCSALMYGNTRVVCAAMYPIERSFFANKTGTGKLSDLAGNFITGVGKPRVDYIQGIKNYWEDLLREYAFFEKLNNVPVSMDGRLCKYVLAKSFADMQSNLDDEQGDMNTIFIVLTIEGMHVLQTNFSETGTPDPYELTDHIAKLKQLDYPPFFVTLTHHFYNNLCGHAQSFAGAAGKGLNQSFGMNTGLTDAGKTVIRELLSKKNGKRIYIDIKHMSALTRKQYFEMLGKEFGNEAIPVIVSHGACNGLRSADDPVYDGKYATSKLMATDLNLYDNEILMVAETRGLFGLQLDERRIASALTLKNTKHSLSLNKIRHYRAELVWNQIEHILELLDRHNLFAWDCIAIGSDYDGIINPLNGYLTAETFVHLQSYVERYAFNYMNEQGKLLKTFNQLPASEIVHRIFMSNGINFLRKWFV